MKCYSNTDVQCKMFIIGWAGNSRFDLDHGISHIVGILNGFMFDTTLDDPVPVTSENLGKLFYGLELTRLKAYVFKPKKSKKRKLSDVLYFFLTVI